ncbi:MAG: hypothetical protein DRH26_00700 [Deltaproteobacteria bacterium]|nr:MAG: hypothetical protein DRH26_00700 [Deltaproteobacteria bacterium]
MTLAASTKALTILSLSATAGTIMAREKDDRAKFRGTKLVEAGWNATAKYASVNKSKSKLRQVGKEIENICPLEEVLNVLEVLSFLLCGLIDLWSHASQNNKRQLDIVIKRVIWCIKLLDPKLNQHEIHLSALDKYESWVV